MMMIARTWRGVTASGDADDYVDYLRRTGFAACRATPANLGVLVLRRKSRDRAEFVFMSLWESPDAARRFAGDEPDRAVFFPEDQRFLVEKDEHVDHFETVLMGWKERPERWRLIGLR